MACIGTIMYEIKRDVILLIITTMSFCHKISLFLEVSKFMNSLKIYT